MTPKDYSPVFDYTLREFLPGSEDTTTVSINHTYALDPANAKIFATLFPQYKPEVFEDNPWLTFRWAFNHYVPWIKFHLTDGSEVTRNAALLAVYWTFGCFTPQQAYDFTIKDIEGLV